MNVIGILRGKQKPNRTYGERRMLLLHVREQQHCVEHSYTHVRVNGNSLFVRSAVEESEGGENTRRFGLAIELRTKLVNRNRCD